MNGKPENQSSNSNANASEADESRKNQQGKPQPADEEIGDYPDPDMVQVDGGDNSFVAGEDEEDGGARKKP